jgi:peptidylprolyl isomerase
MSLLRKFSSGPRVFLDFLINESPAGKLIFELFHESVPKTCENFIRICQGDSEVLSEKGKKLTYEGSKIHRIVPGFLCQGGDITKLNGKGGWSIYGKTFEDEGFSVKHSEAGILSMANSGPNTNNSQFFITFAPCKGLDGKHVAFGKIVEGFEVLKNIENLGTANGKPRQKVGVVKSGLVV